MLGPPYYVRWCAVETLEARRVAFLVRWRGIYFLFLQFGVLRREITIAHRSGLEAEPARRRIRDSGRGWRGGRIRN